MNAEKTGFLIYELRNRKGLTQKELAEKIGRTESSIRKYEAGIVAIPIDVLKEIAKVLDIDFGCITDSENKYEICNLLLRAIQATRAGADVIALVYRNDKEAGVEKVDVIFRNGYKKAVDVTADSGASMIRDIMAQVYRKGV